MALSERPPSMADNTAETGAVQGLLIVEGGFEDQVQTLARRENGNREERKGGLIGSLRRPLN